LIDCAAARIPQMKQPSAPGTDQRVVIVGLGYVGLPLALSFHDAGLTVSGIDAFAGRVAELNAGSSPIDDISDARLKKALAAGFTVVAPGGPEIGEADAIFVCVPTPVTASKDPDLGPVLAAAGTVTKGLKKGQLIVLQSTTFPGTTTGPFREALEKSGLTAGVDFDLAFAPERVNPGDPASAARTTPRLVGATTESGTARAAALLGRINDHVVSLPSPDHAELAKLLENTFRNVNIALVNQLALLCERMGLDVWQVIDAAATKPFGYMKFTPGPGVGGHCIPVDPYYLSWRARQFDFVDRFVELAADINLAMPRHVLELCGRLLNEAKRSVNGSKIVVVGVSFKPDVRDARNSPAADVVQLLRGEGADVRFVDPHVMKFTDTKGVAVERIDTLTAAIAWADLAVVVTPHKALELGELFASKRLVVDTVNASSRFPHDGSLVLRLGDGSARPRS